MNGGTYQVVRKIRTLVETWDTDRVGNQQQIFGRRKETGAPLTGAHETDTPDFEAHDAAGSPVIDPRSHIALAAHENNGGVMIKRRSYNYTDGLDPAGQLNAGLLFLSYQNNPNHFSSFRTGSAPTTYSTSTCATSGSAIFAIPPAPEQGHYLAQPLFS